MPTDSVGGGINHIIRESSGGPISGGFTIQNVANRITSWLISETPQGVPTGLDHHLDNT